MKKKCCRRDLKLCVDLAEGTDRNPRLSYYSGILLCAVTAQRTSASGLRSGSIRSCREAAAGASMFSNILTTSSSCPCSGFWSSSSATTPPRAPAVLINKSSSSMPDVSKAIARQFPSITLIDYVNDHGVGVAINTPVN